VSSVEQEVRSLSHFSSTPVFLPAFVRHERACLEFDLIFVMVIIGATVININRPNMNFYALAESYCFFPDINGERAGRCPFAINIRKDVVVFRWETFFLCYRSQEISILSKTSFGYEDTLTQLFFVAKKTHIGRKFIIAYFTLIYTNCDRCSIDFTTRCRNCDFSCWKKK